MEPRRKRNGASVKLSPEIRRFVELVIGGSTKAAAWCEATGCTPGPTARTNSCRAWKGRAAQAYVAELKARAAKGEVAGGQEALRIKAVVAEERAKLLGASTLSREAELAWLVGAVFIGASELLDEDLTVRPQFAPLVQSYESRPGKDGLTVKVTMVPKLQALKLLMEALGHIEVKADDGDALECLVRRLAGKIAPSVGLHGESVNEAALDAQRAMTQYLS